MFARVNTFMGGLEHVEDGVAMFRDKVVPEIEKQPGFDGAMFLADREGQVVYAVTFWKSEAEMTASEELGKRMAEAAGKQFGSKVETSHCEVALSTLPALVG
jgi:heme-degrading monooxygenase HmoA